MTPETHHDSPFVRNVVTATSAIIILLFCIYGFGMKFVELIVVAREDPDGAFAITPVVNYMLASMGFLFLLGWAAAHGMFHDIEQPKRTMLENEARLNAALPHTFEPDTDRQASK